MLGRCSLCSIARAGGVLIRVVDPFHSGMVFKSDDEPSRQLDSYFKQVCQPAWQVYWCEAPLTGPANNQRSSHSRMHMQTLLLRFWPHTISLFASLCESNDPHSVRDPFPPGPCSYPIAHPIREESFCASSAPDRLHFPATASDSSFAGAGTNSERI